MFEYGCLSPLRGEEQAVDQMRRRIWFWNALVEIEHTHQQAIESVLASIAPGSEAGARPEKGAGAAAYTAYRVARRTAFKRDDVRERIATLDADRLAAVKAAQAQSGLWWCNYDSVLAAYKVARRKPGDLHFHAWRRSRGKVSVRYQQGLAVGTVGDTRFQLEIVPPPDERAATAARRRDYTRAVARVRIGSDGRAPVWLELPVRLHRPLPSDGTIRQVEVVREPLGGRFRWRLLVVVDLPAEDHPVRIAPTVAINFGWRVRPAGLRVAFWRSAAGASGELILPADWVKQMHAVDAIRSARDLAFNGARDDLLAWIKTAGVPDWLREMTVRLGQWKAQGRLAAVALRWRHERFEGDDTAYELLELWRAQDRHDWEHESNLRDQLLRSRREIYRIFAAHVAREAGSVRLHEFDLRPIAQRGADGQVDDLPEPVRLNRTRAAVSTLRLAIQQACNREGVPFVMVPEGERITQTCWRCQQPEPFDAAAHLEHTCSQCGHRYDQDENACRNMLIWTPQTGDSSETSGGLRMESSADDESAQQDDDRRAAS